MPIKMSYDYHQHRHYAQNLEVGQALFFNRNHLLFDRIVFLIILGVIASVMRRCVMDVCSKVITPADGTITVVISVSK